MTEAIREAGGEIYAITSEPQALATNAQADWETGLEHVGDPHQEIEAECVVAVGFHCLRMSSGRISVNDLRTGLRIQRATFSRVYSSSHAQVECSTDGAVDPPVETWVVPWAGLHRYMYGRAYRKRSSNRPMRRT